jgi:hypothetical protein
MFCIFAYNYKEMKLQTNILSLDLLPLYNGNSRGVQPTGKICSDADGR